MGIKPAKDAQVFSYKVKFKISQYLIALILLKAINL